MKRRSCATLSSILVGALLACGGGEPAPEPASEAPAPAEEVGAHNEPPEIASVRLEPEEPIPGDLVTAQVDASDPEDDALTFHYEWRIDGERQRETGDSLRVQGERASLIEVRVRASDGHSESDTAHATVEIGNRPPEVVGVVLEPAGELTVESDLSASPRANDPDGDPIEYSFEWRVNGERAGSGDTLPRRSFDRGDRIELAVVASDGQMESEPFEVEPVTVANAQPTITSAPGGFDGDAVFRYRITAEDPDGDRRYRFELMKGPDGMRIDDVTGELEWSPSAEQSGTHRVELQVSDGRGGIAAQVFDLTVSVQEGQAAESGAAAAPAPEAD